MDQFYMIVLGAIGVLLILMLTAVGLLMYSAKSKPEAPVRSPCPDYWEFDGSGCTLYETKNSGDLTLLNAKQADQSMDGINANKIYYKSTVASVETLHLNPNATAWSTNYPGLTDVCAKGKWATNLGIVWDGYTNTTEC